MNYLCMRVVWNLLDRVYASLYTPVFQLDVVVVVVVVIATAVPFLVC